MNVEPTDWGEAAVSPLARMIARATEGRHEVVTDIQGLVLHRWETPTEPHNYMFAPHLCLIAQGVKRILLGDEAFVYDADSFIVSSVELPIISHIVEATPEKPYLGLTLELDLQDIANLLMSDGMPDDASRAVDRGMGVARMERSLLGAVERLLELLEAPAEIPVFFPLIRREIYCRLLLGSQGERLRQMVRAESRGQRIARAVGWMKAHFDEPLRIDELARHAGMSPSSLHQHFRAVTAMSPLQYLKKMRLNEARRLMLVENMDAGNAGFRVGYESPTQFNREYKRMFGHPPRADIRRLRALQPESGRAAHAGTRA